jgi:3-oxoadipate enol-lactonase
VPKIQVNGIDLFYDVKGVGESLLLIAGFDSDSSTWALMLPALIKQYRVFRIDNRGVGQSSAPESPYSIKQMADDAAALLDYLGVSQTHVVGHSMGGQIAQELTLSYPDKVKSLILLSSWAKGNSKFQTIMALLGDLPSQLDNLLYKKVLFPWLFSEAFYQSGSIEQLMELVQYYPYLSTPVGLYHQSRAILDSDTSDRLAQIDCPTLVVVGKEDILTPVRFSEQLAQGISNAELLVCDRVGHAIVIEAAEIVAKKILNFLSQHS